jgi:voltage-gated potassium channel
MKVKDIKTRIHQILELANHDDKAARTFSISIMSLIVLNVFAVILDTVPAMRHQYSRYFLAFEVFSIAIFSVEYLLRMWCITESTRYSHPLFGRLKYAVTPRALIDLAAIMPFYLPFTGALDLRTLRALRLFRMVRILRMGHYSESIHLFRTVLRKKREELIVTTVLLLILIVISSSLMYFIEHEAQPQVISSIPDAMWWSVNTMTMGYGDICPVTPVGKIPGSVVAILGIGMFALPAGMLGAGFLEEMQARKGKRKCPHCGKGVHFRIVGGIYGRGI